MSFCKNISIYGISIILMTNYAKNGEEKLYFILETKGSTDFYDLRTKEQLKIHCGKQHFKALDNGIEMRVARDWTEFNTNL